jgi:histidinol-phosphatase (PHP family)
MIVDYHTHTALCKHGEGTVDDYVRRALALGLDEIGASEHIPMPDRFDEVHRMTLEQYTSRYAPEVSEAAERYKGTIAVRRGIEADFYAGTEPWVRDFIDENDFDYVIGSVHFLGEWGFDNPVFLHRYEERDIDATYEQYFDTVARSAKSGLFDIIAHCDLVKKFGHRPTKSMRDPIQAMMEAIKKENLAIEINTSGLRKPVREPYPGPEILAVARQLQVPITLGSDAHTPNEVGAEFDVAAALLEQYAGGRISVFEKRQRKEVPIRHLRNAAFPTPSAH